MCKMLDHIALLRAIKKKKNFSRPTDPALRRASMDKQTIFFYWPNDAPVKRSLFSMGLSPNVPFSQLYTHDYPLFLLFRPNFKKILSITVKIVTFSSC